MITIAIVDDNAQYRKAITVALELNKQYHIIHVLENCEQIISTFEQSLPQVVLMDINMPGIDGIKAVWLLKKRFPEIKVLMLTVFEDEEKIFSALRAGANGYLLKKDDLEKISAAIHSVHIGEAPMNGMIASKVIDYFKPINIKQNEDIALTRRENEILQLLINGYSYKEIAANIHISRETINSHIKNIYKKLKVHSRAELSKRFHSS
ncbi:MAG: response regulator transcription factor [Ferruginibacter sp.]|nr:response regulator transcription factor [Ferruginibacter sp.]